MEIVLQWLDELDDLAFAGFSLWRRVRRFCLGVALIAALALLAGLRLGLGTPAVIVLLAVSIYALATWIVVAILSVGGDRSAQSASGNA